MKFLHTSDWHLGASDNDTKSLIEDQKFFIDEIYKIIVEKKVDAVFISGDVFDRQVVGAEFIKLYNYAMSKVCLELHKQVLIIAGNHDGAERLASCNELLQKAGLYIVGDFEKDKEPVTIGNTDIYLLPWITEEKVKSIYPQEKDNINSLEDAYKIVLDNIKKSFDKNKKHFILSHAFIKNAETSQSDKSAEIGYAINVPSSVFDDFDYVALGHLHKPQDITKNIRYSGTPMPYSFGKEEDQEKSVTIIDSDTMEKEIVPLKLLHNRRTIRGTLFEVLHPEKYYDYDITNDYVNIIVTDTYVSIEQNAKIRQIYKNTINVAGKSCIEKEKVEKMSVEELKKLDNNPVEVFKEFCKKSLKIITGDEKSESESEQIEKDANYKHYIELFNNAIIDCENEKGDIDQ